MANKNSFSMQAGAFEQMRDEQHDQDWFERHALAGLVVMVAIAVGCGVVAVLAHANFKF
jgi:hypothetical protein